MAVFILPNKQAAKWFLVRLGLNIKTLDVKKF